MRRSEGLIEGYEAPIHRAIWERVCTMGAPACGQRCGWCSVSTPRWSFSP